MNYQVSILTGKKRGCGFRSAGKTGVGVYLMGGVACEPCERLPYPLLICPCCGGGIKFSRSWTWVDARKLFAPNLAPKCDRTVNGHRHDRCPMCNPTVCGERAGLVWIGKRHYPKPEDFTHEANKMGISRKLNTIPNGAEDMIKKRWLIVFVAHLHAIRNVVQNEKGENEENVAPGVFSAFRPTHVDLVIDDEKKIPERAKKLKDRLGDQARIVKVIRDETQPQRSLL